MAIDALPPSLAATLKDYLDRITVLERSNKLFASAIVGGKLRILSTSEIPIALLGELSPGSTGLRIYLADGVSPMFEVEQNGGFGLPWLSTDWRPYGDTGVTHNVEGYGEISGTTFRRLWQTTSELLFSASMLFRVQVTCPAGSTGELRLWSTAAGAVIGSVKAIPTSTTNVVFEYRIAHGLTIGGGPHFFYLEGRVDTGAGALRVFQPGGMHYGTHMSEVAGGWV